MVMKLTEKKNNEISLPTTPKKYRQLRQSGKIFWQQKKA